jgi:hypothetical protein
MPRYGKLQLVDRVGQYTSTAGGSVSADTREHALYEQLTRNLALLDRARGELFAAIAHRDAATALKAARKFRSVGELLAMCADRYEAPVL